MFVIVIGTVTVIFATSIRYLQSCYAVILPSFMMNFYCEFSFGSRCIGSQGRVGVWVFTGALLYMCLLILNFW